MDIETPAQLRLECLKLASSIAGQFGPREVLSTAQAFADWLEAPPGLKAAPDQN